MYVYDSILYDIENVTLLKLEHKFLDAIASLDLGYECKKVSK